MTVLQGQPQNQHKYRPVLLAALLAWPGFSHAREILGISAGDTTVTMLLIMQAILLAIVWSLYRQQRAMAKLLKVESRTDPLTLLPNRRHFYEVFDSNIALAERHRQPLSLLIIDLDNFKVINDTYGHSAGDEVLRRVGTTLKKSVRRGDCAGRLGGEEFGILLPLTRLGSARILAERLRKKVENLVLSDINEKLKVTASIGVAAHYDNLSADELFELADNAVYAAKTAGKNRIADSHALTISVEPTAQQTPAP